MAIRADNRNTRRPLVLAASMFIAACSSDSEQPATGSDGTGGTAGSGGADSGTPTQTGGTPNDAAAPEAAVPTFTVKTAAGDVIGKLDAKTRSFLGIPYAAPP